MIIRAITKRKQKGIEKYVVYFEDGICLIVSSNPSSMQGISHWGGYFGINDIDIEEGYIANGKIINWIDLPSIIKSHIEQMMFNAQK